MASKEINLDELIKDAITVNLGDPCPFCKGKDKFMNTKENDFVRHIVEEHKPTYAKIIGRTRE